MIRDGQNVDRERTKMKFVFYYLNENVSYLYLMFIHMLRDHIVVRS